MVKTEKLGLKVLPAHKRALEAIAVAEGEPVAVVLRRIIRAEAERRGLWVLADTQPTSTKSGEALPCPQ